MSGAMNFDLIQEATAEALGILEVLWDSGDLPKYARPAAYDVLQKYRRARGDAPLPQEKAPAT